MKPTILAVLAGSLSLLSLPAGCKKAEPPTTHKVAPPVANPTPMPVAPASQPARTPSLNTQGALPPKLQDRTKRVDGKNVLVFGQDITAAAPATALAAVLEKPQSFTGREVVVTGKVRMACKRKGCWMELAPTMDKTSQGARVTFKSYGFFVPKDSAGADAKVEGQLAVKKIPRDEVEHMESEGGRFAKKEADGSANEVRLVATGVELIR